MDKILDLMNRMGEPITSSNYWEVRMKIGNILYLK